MSALGGRLEELDERTFNFIEERFKPVQQLQHETVSTLNALLGLVRRYQETGVLESFSQLSLNNNKKNSTQTKSSDAGAIKKKSPLKENIAPVPQESPKQRPKRNAFKEATQNIGAQVNASLNAKLRRPLNVDENVLIKQEKRSTTTIKKENVEEMPPPTSLAPKKKTRQRKPSKVQVKQEKIDESHRESDVIVQDVYVPIVSILDSDDDSKIIPKKTGKRSRNDLAESDSEKEVKGKRSKSDEGKGNVTSQTVYEDAVDSVQQQTEAANATFVPNSPVNKNLAPTMNETVVVENPKMVNKPYLTPPRNMDDLLTEDESEDEAVVIKPVKTKIPKQVFSAFEQSPVKAKVEAFEKLQHETTAIPMRVTRTKTKAQAKEQNEEEQAEPRSNVKEKAKLFTPSLSRFIPKAESTAAKTAKRLPSNNESLLSSKSASALKASQAEFREREKRRREKEQDAQKKREALLLAHAEEKKRKREEKQLKAQQQREALEREKLKILEVQRVKDERHKQILAEQEERKMKLKEDLEKKRMMAKTKAIEEKKKEEQRRLEEQKKAKELTKTLAKHDDEIAEMAQKHKTQRNMPQYMKYSPPFLPTNDCFDSDHEDYEKNVISKPAWAKNIEKTLAYIEAAKDKVKNTFFSRKAQSADLREIFEVIDSQKLKRSSSAIWHHPPRYTMLHATLGSHDETEEFFEDSDE